jgi:sulfite exporter TauE/SafE
MKKFFLPMLSVCVLTSGLAQSNFQDSIAQSRNQLTKGAMVTLGTWAIANIATGFIVASQTSGETRYFWLMNSYWNFINLSLAVPGYLGALRMASMKIGFAQNVESQLAIEKLYVFNFGLDLAYMAGGLYLGERGKTEKDLKKSQQFSGYGNSIVLQGAFLLLMDGVMFTLHHKNTKLMNKHLRQLELSAGPGGLGIVYSF